MTFKTKVFLHWWWFSQIGRLMKKTEIKRSLPLLNAIWNLIKFLAFTVKLILLERYQINEYCINIIITNPKLICCHLQSDCCHLHFQNWFVCTAFIFLIPRFSMCQYYLVLYIHFLMLIPISLFMLLMWFFLLLFLK